MNKFNNHYCQHSIPATNCSICSYTRVQTNVSLINVGEINEPIKNSEQLPVAWMHTNSGQIFKTEKPNQFDLHLFTPLYTHPMRELTDDEIVKVLDDIVGDVQHIEILHMIIFAKEILQKASE